MHQESKKKHEKGASTHALNLDLDGDNFILERARLLSRLPTLLTLQSELVALLARDTILVCEVLSGDAGEVRRRQSGNSDGGYTSTGLTLRPGEMQRQASRLRVTKGIAVRRR